MPQHRDHAAEEVLIAHAAVGAEGSLRPDVVAEDDLFDVPRLEQRSDRVESLEVGRIAPVSVVVELMAERIEAKDRAGLSQRQLVGRIEIVVHVAKNDPVGANALVGQYLDDLGAVTTQGLMDVDRRTCERCRGTGSTQDL